MITNNTNLPESLVAAAQNAVADYDRGVSDVTATELVAPPQVTALRWANKDKITEDAADLIWALLGSSVHYIIERSSGKDDLQEIRLYMPVSGWTVGGKLDNLAMKSGILTDYKVTTVYQVMNGVRREWIEQLNILAELVRQNGGHIGGIKVVAILRDWSKMKAHIEAVKLGLATSEEVMAIGNADADAYDNPSAKQPECADRVAKTIASYKGKSDYPLTQAITIDIPIWTSADVRDFIAKRIEDLKAVPVRECTDEERWAKPPTFAVMKAGNKRALRVFDAEERAEIWMNKYLRENADSLKPFSSLKLAVEQRPGNPCVRCDHYCNVNKFCEQYKRLKGGITDVGTDDLGTA